MKTLFIMRHAKSSWDDPDLSDFERPLNNRGLKTAPLMGELMSKNNFTPQIIISSPAIRAKQTANLVKKSAGFDAEIFFDERIYEASPMRLSEVISDVEDEYDSAMIVGHNPGFENLVRVLTGKLEPMPTAALAVVDLEINSWKEVNAETGTLRKLIRPKDEQKAISTN
ncbi:MAG: SixA phosphatase family protein [Pyrinomonadaceae bacterium]